MSWNCLESQTDWESVFCFFSQKNIQKCPLPILLWRDRYKPQPTHLLLVYYLLLTASLWGLIIRINRSASENWQREWSKLIIRDYFSRWAPLVSLQRRLFACNYYQYGTHIMDSKFWNQLKEAIIQFCESKSHEGNTKCWAMRPPTAFVASELLSLLLINL